MSPEETGVIILGDAGYNFWLNKTDEHGKRNTYGMTVYCVRGNHEERPENLGYQIIHDPEVCGQVYLDPVNEKIRYFMDGGEYIIAGHSTLVIGGAYSVDKWWRLQSAAAANRSHTGWFKDEQLTEQEMQDIEAKVRGKSYDFVFSHTCPLSWEPADLFLSIVDQNTVDKSMERWLDSLKNKIIWGVWCFGHYHSDRLERPHVEMYYEGYDSLQNIWERWSSGEELVWWLEKSPNYKESV